MNALLLLLTLTTSTLVLRSGDRIAVEGTLREADGVYTFRSGGLLYSLPASEVLRVEDVAQAAAEKPVKKLRLSDEERKRLLEELAKNHEGTEPPPPQKFVPEAAPVAVEPIGEEASWRARARDHEENIRRAQEELALLESRIDDLRAEIHSLVSLGYHAQQFTYQTTQLARATEQIPYAKLEVTRTERAFAQFKEDARRAGVMPGWLR
jgi:polyhydroxyalkanoate synthesis regulator phasin